MYCLGHRGPNWAIFGSGSCGSSTRGGVSPEVAAAAWVDERSPLPAFNWEARRSRTTLSFSRMAPAKTAGLDRSSGSATSTSCTAARAYLSTRLYPTLKKRNPMPRPRDPPQHRRLLRIHHQSLRARRPHLLVRIQSERLHSPEFGEPAHAVRRPDQGRGLPAFALPGGSQGHRERGDSDGLSMGLVIRAPSSRPSRSRSRQGAQPSRPEARTGLNRFLRRFSAARRWRFERPNWAVEDAAL